jgi:hypothetical protein
MEAFLKKLADHIFKNHQGHFQDLSVVVPNRRASLFLGKYLSAKSDIPIWSPQFYSIEDFVFKLSGFQLVPLLDLLFELYSVHIEIEGPNKHSFDRFNGWGQLLLKDFNDLDLYLKDADEVFRYLSEAKAISLWHLDPDQMTNMERDYLKFYASLGEYYKMLRARLMDKNLAYQGMAYRYVAENIQTISLDDKPIIFAGFNALSPSEEALFSFFEKRGQAEVFWDIDHYYFDDPKQEAGAFLRKQLSNRDSKKINWITNDLITDTKEVNVYGLSGDVSMAKMAGNILQELAMDKKKNGKKLSDETAVVLANEQLIVPILYSLPDEIETFNITMGYPSRLTRVYELVIQVLDLFIQHVDADGKPIPNPQFYHRTLEAFLLHPLVQQHINKIDHLNAAQVIIDEIRNNNISFISQKEFPLSFNIKKHNKSLPFLSVLSKGINNAQDLLSIILSVLEDIFEGITTEAESLMDREFLFYYMNLIRRMDDLLREYPYVNQVNTLKKLFISLASSQGVPFTGEPLTGVQIMGMLETRNLDFENLILLSANEGMLPKSHVYQSFILPDIKRELGLPLPVDNDSVFAYHFYRLMQRAKNIFIIYNTQHDRTGQGELSRYVQQLAWEWKDKNPNIKWNQKTFHIPLSSDEYDTEIHFPKDDFALGRLKEIAKKGFSPSTLNTYKSCSLKFYFHRVLEMYTEEEVEETLAANTQGSVIHGVLEEFYKPLNNKTISKDFIAKMQKEYPTKLRNWFEKEFKKGDIDHGQNLLMHEVAKRYIDDFIKNEKKLIEGEDCTILATENEYFRNLNISVNGEKISVKIKGKADRVDRLGNRVRVIDYKTGKVEIGDVRLFSRKVDVWSKMFGGDKDKAFQLMMYAWLYHPNLDSRFELETGISAMKYRSKYMPLNFLEEHDSIVNSERLTRFESDLKSLIEGIFDSASDFTQCEDKKQCKFCDYSFICGRWEE